MNATGDLLNVIGVEATCWEWEPPAGQVSEIIEIGVAVVDVAAGERVGQDRILVRPAASTVSAFCTERTGLTQAEVDGGVSFPDACELLASRYEASSRPWASWGDYARQQFEAQAAAQSVPYPFGPVHVNVKAAFAVAAGLRHRLGLAQALQIAGLKPEGRRHSGPDDTWNVAALVVYLIRRGRWPS